MQLLILQAAILMVMPLGKKKVFNNRNHDISNISACHILYASL